MSPSTTSPESSDTAVRRVLCVGIPRWKQGYLPSFIAGPELEVLFVSESALSLRAHDAVLLWGTQNRHRSVAARADATRVPVWRMEDGFLRSVGLGSDLEEPLSLVVDTCGIYYDPNVPSDLERTLAEGEFGAAELARANSLRTRIVDAGISKYNVGLRRPVGPVDGGRPVVLVIGQVEDDASIELGTLDVRRNEDLLRAARLVRPHAHLIYKPHPDVVRGHRSDSLPLSLARRLCDEVVVHASLADCLNAADEVHTMTSLVGFEALMRGLRVMTYGQPFYSGWGLTEDRHPHPRRTRALSLDELVAGTLLRYARYVDPVTGQRTTAEATLERLLRKRRETPLKRLGLIGRQVRRLRNIVRGALGRAL